MRNDLISRSTVIEEFYKRVSGDFMVEDVEKIEEVIMDVPVAYDAERVVEQLEECKVEDCIVCAFEKAIEIVKAGGADENRRTGRALR